MFGILSDFGIFEIEEEGMWVVFHSKDF